mmetsp:Transcript_9758/g.13790  ORF Transcript_9758/g.13790 Transcript_9758/m.13790 type:complete len:100 (+) Transcript_9758:1379-1678(+)
MKMKFREDGKLEINLNEHLESIEEFGDTLGPMISSVAGKRLFDIDDKARKLSRKKVGCLDSVIAKLLWVLQRGRPDTCVRVKFLCTRVKDPDVKDWKKL